MRRRWQLLLSAALLGGLAAWLAIQATRPSTTVPGETEPVVIARREIPARVRITREMVALAEVPAGTRHPLALSDLTAALDLVSIQTIQSGEQVLGPDLVPANQAGYSPAVPDGMRLVAIAVDEVAAVGYHLRPGDWVDVLATRRQGQSTVVCRVAQAVQVWAVGTPDLRQEKATRSVTLVVTSHQAEHLLKDGEGGALRLALRTPPQGGKGNDGVAGGGCW